MSVILIKVPVPTLPNSKLSTPGDPFIDSVHPYVELFEFGTGVVRAATDIVLDWSVKWVLDAAGELHCTFAPVDRGLSFTAGTYNTTQTATLSFSDTLLGATNPYQTPSTPYANPIVIGGTPFPSTTYGTAQFDLQMKFSLGGGDFIDAKKMVLNTQRDADAGKPILVESGNTLWEQYGKVIIPHMSVEDVRFIDLMFCDPGMMGYYNSLPNNNAGVNYQITNTTSTTPFTGFIGTSNLLPFVGGIFKIYCPVNFGGIIANPGIGGAVNDLLSSYGGIFGSVPSLPQVPPSTIINPEKYASFIYIPLVCKELAAQAISSDMWAGTLTKVLEAIISKAAAIVSTPYVAHYVEDSSDLYTPLTAGAYPDLNTVGTNTLMLGQILRSPVIFISANVKEVIQPAGDINNPNIATFAPTSILPTDTYNVPTSYEFQDNILDSQFTDFFATDPGTVSTQAIFDPTQHARIEKGITITPDYSATYSSAYFLGGSTDCDFPRNGRVTATEVFNDRSTPFGTLESWMLNVPILAVHITDLSGGLYYHIGNQQFLPLFTSGGVYDVKIDSNTNDIYIATGSGVYVCRNFSFTKTGNSVTQANTNVFNPLGDFHAPVQKIQLNVGLGTANTPGQYIKNKNRLSLDENGNPYTGALVYALALGTIDSQKGVFSYPIDNPLGLDPILIKLTNQDVAKAAGHGGWDIIVSDNAILSFAVLQDSTVYWCNSTNAGTIYSQNIVHPFNISNNATLQYYMVDDGDALAGVANGVTGNNSTSTNVIANSLQAIQRYPIGSLNNSDFLDYLLITTNGVTGEIYYICAQDGPPQLIKTGDTLSKANGSLPLGINMIRILPQGTYINQALVYAICASDQGLYYASSSLPIFNWLPMNSQSGIDAENLNCVAVGNPYSDLHQFGLSGYSLNVTYTPMFTAGDNTFFETMAGGTWWQNRVNDKISLASNFYKIYYQWVALASKYGYTIPSAFRGQSFPPPTPEYIQIPLNQIYEDSDYNASIPQGPNAQDLSNICWIRNRNERGEFYYYIGRVATVANPSPVSLLRQGQAVATVSSLSVDDDLVTTSLCSDQLALVSRKWFLENSVPPFTLVLESSFANRNSGLRFIRPMQIVTVYFEDTLYTVDGVPHIFMKVDGEFYVLEHEIKYGGDSRPYAVTTTTVSTEMQKQRLNPDDIAADLQEIVKNLQLRG